MSAATTRAASEMADNWATRHLPVTQNLLTIYLLLKHLALAVRSLCHGEHSREKRTQPRTAQHKALLSYRREPMGLVRALPAA